MTLSIIIGLMNLGFAAAIYDVSLIPAEEWLLALVLAYNIVVATKLLYTYAAI